MQETIRKWTPAAMTTTALLRANKAGVQRGMPLRVSDQDVAMGAELQARVARKYANLRRYTARFRRTQEATQ